MSVKYSLTVLSCTGFNKDLYILWVTTLEVILYSLSLNLPTTQVHVTYLRFSEVTRQQLHWSTVGYPTTPDSPITLCYPNVDEPLKTRGPSL